LIVEGGGGGSGRGSGGGGDGDRVVKLVVELCAGLGYFDGSGGRGGGDGGSERNRGGFVVAVSEGRVRLTGLLSVVVGKVSGRLDVGLRRC
jgi:hypothetical protein